MADPCHPSFLWLLKLTNHCSFLRQGICPVHGPGDKLAVKHGAQMLSKSMIHVALRDHVQRVLKKALADNPVTISIIGGSGMFFRIIYPIFASLLVSACSGAGDDPVSPRCYPSLFFQWWNFVFLHPATEFINGAMRPCDAPVLHTLGSATHTTSQTSPTSLLSSWIAKTNWSGGPLLRTADPSSKVRVIRLTCVNCSE